MRTFFKLLLLTIAMMVCYPIHAQQPQERKQRMSREQLAEKQARHIAERLKFTDEDTKQFVATFTDCQKEMWQLHPHKPKDKGERTEAQAKQSIKDQFAISEKILRIRQKYYKKYSSFLTQTQIQQVYAEEKKMMERFMHHHNKDGEHKPPQRR